ncbi:ABC transporter permease [Streptomyces sp. CAU 1734]|uniref:ABC transporter permease n=1 Tax=Streptomyces sp. CAU 1734 TaxID=3140360 RepID=UPI00326135EE
MAGFLFRRARGHRALLAAVLFAVLLTTSVLATLAAFADSVGDAGLRQALRGRESSAAALLVTAENSGADRADTGRDVRRGAERAFDGLPVTLRPFDSSGPYALPREPRAERGGEPDLTTLAVLDRSRVRLTAGAWPGAGGAAGTPTGVAVPEAAAERLGLKPGPRVLKLTDRMGGPPVRIRVTGVYRPADRSDAYWQLDELGGRGVRQDSFTTYGPLITDAAALGSGRISRGAQAWLATADFGSLRAERIGDLRAAAKKSQQLLSAQPSLGSGVIARTSLPGALDQLERALLVSRATLLIVALQLVLLSAYALLLVSRLLTTERESETRVLLARGASRGRIAGLAALEALLLAVPAAVLAPLLAGPLTRLLAGQGLLARIGVDLDGAGGPTPLIRLIGALVALACAVAVVLPALTAARAPRGRERSLPAPLRAGADLALLAVAGVAYWQLEQRTSGSGPLSTDRDGRLGIDPLLVVAPALALLAGTVLTLRLLPPAARLAERRASRGRGLTAPLAGWQLSRRPLRGAGPVLLLVLSVAMGMLAIGQGASWERSQDDQADFRSGAPVRVIGGGSVQQLGRGGVYDKLPGVAATVPVARTGLPLSGGRQAAVLAVDSAAAEGRLRVRADLAGTGVDPERPLSALRPATAARAGIVLPDHTDRLILDVTLGTAGGGAYRPKADDRPDLSSTEAAVTVEDRFGVPYRLPLGTLRPDGKRHALTLDLAEAADAPTGRPAGPLALTGVEFDEAGFPGRVVPKRFAVGAVRAVVAGGGARAVPVPADLVWEGAATPSVEPSAADGREAAPAVTRVTSAPGAAVTAAFHTGTAMDDGWGPERTVSVRLSAKRAAPAVPAALVSERFLESTAAKAGSLIDLQMPGGAVKVRIAGVLRSVPTTGTAAASAGPGRAPADGGALLLDLRSVNRVLATRPDAALPPSEWWLYTAPGGAADVAASLRERPELDPGQVEVRDELAAELHGDPLGAGPQSALFAAVAAAAALAAVGFAVSTAGALRQRAAEFAVLRAIGAPRRQLARLVAVEQTMLIGLALLIGTVLGALLTRAVVPLIVLTGQATRPVPEVLVQLPMGEVAVLLAAVAAVPVLIVTVLALRRGESVTALRARGGE